MEQLFKDLAWACYQYELRFEHIPDSEGIVITDGKEFVSGGFLDLGKTPEGQLKKMIQEVETYANKQPEEIPESRPPKGMTSEDVKMKETGHKQSDFL